jgi:phytol kinase
MVHNDLIGFGLFVGYFIVAGLPPILLKVYLNTPFEVTRKMYHLVIALSIFPLLNLFSSWYAAVLGVILFVLMIYPILKMVEDSSLYKRIAVEREGGEFRRSLIIVQLSIALLIFVFWGLLGIDWQYIAVVAVMAWGFGDAAAALVGKAFGRHRILHPQIEGAKTYEGTFAMFVVAGLTIFFTLLVYAGQSWQVSFAVAALIAPVSATVELFSRQGTDTLTVPLTVAFSVLPLMFFFSLLGV